MLCFVHPSTILGILNSNRDTRSASINMYTGKIKKLVSLSVIVLVSIWVFSSQSFSENAGNSNLQGPEVISTSVGQQNFCKNLIEDKLVELCKRLQLEKLQLFPIPGLKIPADILLFVRDVQDPISYFTDPEKFKEITQDPDSLVRRLGFDNLAQLEQVNPGGVFVYKWVRYDDLEKFTNGKNPDDLMQFANRILFLLEVPGNNGGKTQAKSSLTFLLDTEAQRWRWARRGAPNRTSKMYEYRKNSHELLEFSGLNLFFLISRESGNIGLIPLYDYKLKEITLKAGGEYPAEQIFTALQNDLKHLKKREDALFLRRDRPPVR